MNLVLDSGNSSIKLALFEAGNMEDHVRIEGDLQELQRFLGDRQPDACMVSEVGELSRPLINFLEDQISQVYFLNHQTPLPFINRYQSPETLGYDRIAGVAGAMESFPGRNALVIDAGTAITYDFISAEAEYLGGNIAPGLGLRFRSLHEHTSRLPLIGQPGDFPILGTNTREAITAGVAGGLILEAEGLISRLQERYPDLVVILTGGDAAFLADRIKKPIFASPFLVLSGLNLILDFQLRQLRQL